MRARLPLLLLPWLLVGLLLCCGCEKSSSGSSSAAVTGASGTRTGSGASSGTAPTGGAAPVLRTPGLQLLSSSPVDGESLVAHDRSLRVSFDRPLDPASVTAARVRLEVLGREVAVERRVLGADLIVEPQVVLAPGAAYTLHLEPGLGATTGELLQAPLALGFHTDPAGGRRGLTLQVGVAVVDITPPVGVPLGGHGGPPRRLANPDLDASNFHTFFAPSTGVRDPILAKALVLDDGVDRVAFLTLDLIAADAHAAEVVAQKLAQRGVVLDPRHVMLCASHNHSGPGAISDLAFWQLVAMDLFQFSIFDALTSKLADALELAVQSLEPAHLAIGSGQLTTITKNRRAGLSPHYSASSIDPELGVIAFDRPDGSPLATLYNFAIHGTAYGAPNMEYSADLMGEASQWIESQLGGTAFFINGAEGDISPDRSVASGGPAIAAALGLELGQKVLQIRAGLAPVPDVDLASAWAERDMGAPALTLTATSAAQAPPQFQAVLAVLPPATNVGIPLPGGFMDRSFRYQAVRLQNTLLSSVPGEALHEIGLEIKARGAALGFDRTFVCGLANGHMSYITTPTEYAVGGYESIATLFGANTGDKVITSCEAVAAQVVR